MLHGTFDGELDWNIPIGKPFRTFDRRSHFDANLQLLQLSHDHTQSTLAMVGALVGEIGTGVVGDAVGAAVSHSCREGHRLPVDACCTVMTRVR